ncbi:MAG: Maf family protein [Peptococcaceae bacterium]
MVNIILASASPRRQELLRQIKLPFEVKVSNVNEDLAINEKFEIWVQKLALLKAQAVAETIEKGVVIGADTIVVKDNRILGKPGSRGEAADMLNFLSGSIHQVMTGIALIDPEKERNFTDVEITEVRFKELTSQEITAYIASGEPMDKAGAYGIQGLGALLVEGIKGCYFNVVGLPLNRLARGLKVMDVEVWHDFTGL